MINQIKVSYSANLTQINKSFVDFDRYMHSKNLAAVAALAVMLVATTAALATAHNAFAGNKRYSEKSQGVAQANYCGSNSVLLPENVWCQNTASQIRGDYNNPALSSSQGARGDGDCPIC
jgi:hypothetical protein